MKATVLHGDCASLLDQQNIPFGHVDLTFLDPPFNQDKGYNEWDDNLPEAQYWKWMGNVCTKIYRQTASGGAICFMQREKKTESVLRCLRESGWVFQNLIIWKKKTSAVPGMKRFGKHYQIIAFATKGERPRVFHRLRINPPLPASYKYERENGMFLTDVWDDIRELTSGYFAGDEALRDAGGQSVAQATGTDSTASSDNPFFDKARRCCIGSVCGFRDDIGRCGAVGAKINRH